MSLNREQPMRPFLDTLADAFEALKAAFEAYVVPAGSIGTNELANGAVTTPKIANGSVNMDKLASDVQIPQPTDAQVTSAVNAALAAHPEWTTTVQDGSITGVKIADDTIPDAKLAQTGGVLSEVHKLIKTYAVSRIAAGSTGVSIEISNGDVIRITNSSSATLAIRLRESSSSTENLQTSSVSANSSIYLIATTNAAYISVYFNAAGSATFETGEFIEFRSEVSEDYSKIDSDIVALQKANGFNDLSLDSAVIGGYNYNNNLVSATTYKTIDVDISDDVIEFNIIGTTAAAFCLYHFLNSDGQSIASNENTTEEINYNKIVTVPKEAVTLRFTYQFEKAASLASIKMSDKDEAIIEKAEDVYDVPLDNALSGAYLYDGSFNTSTNYRHISIDVRGYKKIRIIGTTQNAFCLYRFLDTYGNAVSTPEQITALTSYDLTLDIPLTVTKVVVSYQNAKTHYVGLIGASNPYIANVRQNFSYVHDVQRSIAEEWGVPFVDVGSLNCGYRHVIPETAHVWSQINNSDLTQNQIMMSDGIHPFLGDGLTQMYAATIARQLNAIPPKYVGSDLIAENMWSGKTLLWMGTSIPAGSDPAAGAGASYPAIVAQQLGASVVNIARGSSCVRINSSDGRYTNMVYAHFLRSLSRTLDEVDIIVDNWGNIHPLISGSPATLSAEEIATMKSHSYESLLLPYLDGTQQMPDAFIIDHGFNDRRPIGRAKGHDMYLQPTLYNIQNGLLENDGYMTENNYAKLKESFDSQLDKVGHIEDFASTLNRNCFKGAMNFIITMIMRYNPTARVIIVSNYN